jgi:ATP-binding cassette subfamily C protein
MFLILCAIILKSVLVLIANTRAGYTVAQIATDLRLELIRALLASRWRFHLQQPVGALANAIATEAQRACKAFLCGATVTIALIQAIVAVCVALLVSVKASLLALVAGIVIFYSLRRFVAKGRRAGERQTRLLKSLLSYLADSLQSIKPIKAMGLEKLAESVLFKETTKLNRALRKQVNSKEYLRAFQEPLRFIFLLIGFYIALKYLALPLASMMVLIFLMARVLSQLSKVQEEYQKMVMFESGYWSLQGKIREARGDRENVTGTRMPTLKESICLESVSFAYEKKEILQDVNIVFPAGMISAIVGPSGSGKTTIVDLVIGLLRADKGKIRIDQQLLEDIDLRKWRSQIGYVPQDSWLLHDTVFNNVTLGDKALTQEDATGALRAAGAWDFVQAMSHGIDSIVGERGGKLSGGQRQRIAIARALVHKPKLLILDEATTALDPNTEKAICNTLRELRGSLTIIAISHQPAVLEVADRAYRLQDGLAIELTETGSTASLNSEKINGQPDEQIRLVSDQIKLR